MHIESLSLTRERELSEGYDFKIAHLQQDLKIYQASVAEN